MKKNRLLFIVVIAVCLLTLIPLLASAENKPATLSQTPFDVVQGETFTTTLYVEKGSNICSMKAVLNYDPEIVTLVRCTVSDDAIVDTTINDETNGQIVLTLASSRNLSAQLSLVDITFKVNDFLADDTYDLLTIDESESYFRRLNSNNIAENIEYTANLQELHIYKYGDINLDGVVDGSDAVYILRYAAGLSSGVEGSDFYLPYYENYDQYNDHQKYMLKIGDAFFDNEITGQDSVSVLRYAAGFTTEIMGSRVDLKFVDSSGALYMRKTVLFGGELTEVPPLPVVEGYDDGKWTVIDSSGNNVPADFSEMESNISIYAVYDSYLSSAMQYYKDLLTTMYYSGDLSTGLSSDQTLTNSLVYQDDYTARVTWSSSNNAVLNATTGKFTKPTYESKLTLTATITSYKDVKIESTDTISFVYNVKGRFITPRKSDIADWLNEYFEYGIDYDLKLPTLIDNERVGSDSDYEVRVTWEEKPASGNNIPISSIKRDTSERTIDLIATLTYNGLPLEDDGKIYIDNVRVSPITKDEVRASVIEQIAGKVNLTVTTNTELWSDESIYGVNITWTSNNTSIATIANNVITISDDAINGTNLPLTAHVSYYGNGKQYSFDLGYTVSIANNNSLLVRGTNIDADLYDALKTAAGVSGPLTTESLKSPKFVYLDLCDYPDITSLRGLTYCTNLRVLNISGLNITDGINEIATLTKLQAFIARGCNLSNLSDGGVPVLKNLADLRLLDLSDNKFQNLDSVLSSDIKYGKLNEIYLSNNRLNDISGLNRAPALNVLVLSGNGLESDDVTQLAGYKYLTYLSLADNKITDISMLAGLKNLVELRLQNNNISNIKPLSGMVYLEALYLGNNNINVDIGFLNTLAKLRILFVNDNNIDSISQLTMLSQLESINVTNNNIDNLAVLENYKDTIKEIYAENNKLKSIGFVSDMTKLTVLMLSGNPVFATNSSDLANLSELRVLTLSGIPLNDLSFLNGMNTLIWLDVSDCGLTSFRILSETLCTDETTGNSYYQVTNYIDNVAAIASQKKTLYYLDVSGNDFSRDITGKSFSGGIPAEFNSLYILNKIRVFYADSINLVIYPGTLFAQMPSLMYVSVENDGLTDMSWLSDLRYLVYVDLADNNIGKVDLGSYISMYSKGSLKYLFLDTNAENCEFKNAYYSYNGNVLEELSLAGCGVTDMSLLPDMNNIRYLNISDNPLEDLEGLVPISHSINRYQTVEELDLSGLEVDVDPITDLNNLKTVYAVSEPSGKLFFRNDITVLYGLFKNNVDWYLYDKSDKLDPTASVEGEKILNEIEDISCDITVAADNKISDNNPFIIDEINDFDITWTLSNPDNYEIVDNHLSVKDYSGIEDEALTVTATITVYPDQSPVSREFVINTHILRASAAYYTISQAGYSEQLTRDSSFKYNLTLKAAETDGFSTAVKPVEDNIAYGYSVIAESGSTIPYSNVITVQSGHNFTIKSNAPLNSTLTISIKISHNNKSGTRVIDVDGLTASVTVVSRTFTATFEMDGGTIVDRNGVDRQTSEFAEDTLIFENLTYSKPGYEFQGWYRDSDFSDLFSLDGSDAVMPSENIILYAKWVALSYTVHFDANGGSVTPTSMQALSDVRLGQLPTPERQYYTFDGWFLEDGTTKVTSASKFARTEDLTLYAHWTLNSFIVTFNANGGTTGTTSLRGYCGTALGTLPTPTRDYYSFDGWYTDGGTQVTSSTVYTTANDITVYAHWTINPLIGPVLASEMPSDAQVVDRKWTYTLREFSDSSSSTKDGWVPNGKTRTGWTAETGPVYSNPSNGERNVRSEQYISSYGTKTIYVFYWWSSSYNGNPARAKIDGYPNKYTLEIDYSPSNTSQRPISLDGSNYKRWNGNNWYLCWFESSYQATDTSKPIYSTRWYYQDPIYTYHFYRDLDNLEAQSDPSGQANVSNVQEWVTYRER
ncbi:MAG: InlB B-repeat-containing protein [Clostridia bacterium]|nr:InlB B-repeat-containing protein [Clostridia bacterium]